VVGTSTALKAGREYVRSVSDGAPRLFDLWLEAVKTDATADDLKSFRDGLVKAAEKNNGALLKEFKDGCDKALKMLEPRKDAERQADAE
jgi:hypothetical protein